MKNWKLKRNTFSILLSKKSKRKVDQSGKTLSFCSAEIRSQDESVLFATGKQTKLMLDYPGPLTVLGVTLDDLKNEEFDINLINLN